MSSSKKLEVNKNKIITWLQEDKIPCEEVDVSKVSTLAWNIAVDHIQVSVYSVTDLPDRVFIQKDIRFPEDIRELVNKKWDTPKLNSLLINIETTLTNLNVRHQFLFNDKKEFTGVRMNLILIEGLNKETLLNSHFRVSEVFLIMMQNLSSLLGVEMNKLKQEEKKHSKNPLAS